MTAGPAWDRMPPVSPEAERAALGACLMDREALEAVLEILQPEDFYDLNHRAAFEVIHDMARRRSRLTPSPFWMNWQGSARARGWGASPSSVL